MAFRYNDIGRLITDDPGKARSRLERLFGEHAGSRSRVAKELGVDERTLARWLTKLGRAGHPVTGRRPPGKPPGKPPRRDAVDGPVSG